MISTKAFRPARDIISEADRLLAFFPSLGTCRLLKFFPPFNSAGYRVLTTGKLVRMYFQSLSSTQDILRGTGQLLKFFPSQLGWSSLNCNH